MCAFYLCVQIWQYDSEVWVIHSKSCSAQFVLIANIQCSLKLFCLFCCRLGFGTCVTVSKRDCYIKLSSSLWSEVWVWERKITFIRQCCNIDIYWFCIHTICDKGNEPFVTRDPKMKDWRGGKGKKRLCVFRKLWDVCFCCLAWNNWRAQSLSLTIHS